MAGLILDNLLKEFRTPRGRTLRALDGLSLAVAEGEFLAVVGPSGCGKTTLLRLIAGLEAPTSGTITMGGTVMSGLDPAKRDLAMVFQQDALLPHLTARENIELGPRLRGCRREEIQARIQEAIDLLQLGPELDRLPRALSGGERQRVALARAIVRRPRLFLLDEPLSRLDAPQRISLRAQIRELHQRLGVTAIYVTHDQTEAMALGQRVAVLQNGILRQIATPSTLYENPAHEFVAGFVGSPPMNLWRGRLAVQGGALWFHAPADGSGLSLCLTESHRKTWGGWIDREVALGIRPEWIFDPNDARAGAASSEIEAEVQSTEFLGADVEVQWSCGVTRFKTRCSSGLAPVAGSTGRLQVDVSKACLFDGKDGRRMDLTTPASSTAQSQPEAVSS